MAFPVGAAIVAGGSLLGSGANAYSQGRTNKKSREWNERMWGKQQVQNQMDWWQQNQYDQSIWNQQNQYNEGLWNKQNEYNESIWHKMNDYNSPMNQMARFKEAGLNPNLIYGQSNTGGSISTANFESDKMGRSEKGTSPVQGWSPRAPQFDFNEGIMSYFAARESSARTNNLEAQESLIKQDVAYKAAQTANTLQNTARGKFDLDLVSDLRKTSIDAAEANLRKTNVESDIALARNEREAVMNVSNLREAVQRIANMRGQNVNAALDAELKTIDINLKRIGVNPHDPAWMRVLGQQLNNLGELKQGIKDFAIPRIFQGK